MALHIGIVGCSAEGAALCYRTICTEGEALFGRHGHPEVAMHTASLADYETCLHAGDLDGVAELMLASAEKLAAAGADFLICPDNTIHQAFELVEPRSPLPWLHIARIVADSAVDRGLRRLAVLGTRWLMESDVYPGALGERGLDFMIPEPGERETIDRIIMAELVEGRFDPASTERLCAVIARMGRAGCDGVVLGCTELPLVLDDANSPLPPLDSTRLLARVALRHAARAG